MQLPSTRLSGETLLKEYGLYHETRLKGDKNLREMAGAWGKAQERLKVRVDAYEAAQVAVMTAMAVRDGEDAALDEGVRRFYGALLAKAKNNRKSPIFTAYFPEGLPAIVEAPMEAEIQKVGVLLAKLEKDEDEELKTHAGPLTAAMNSLMEAVDAHKAALDAQVKAFGMVELEKINWLDTYKLNHRTLAQLYYKDPKKPDIYFKPVPRAKKAKGAPAEPAPA